MPKPEMSYRIPVHAATLLLISHDLSSTMTAPVWDGHGHTAVFKTDKNEDLLESTGNSAQCHVAAGTGGGFGGGRVREYVWLSPLTAHLKLSQHRSSATLQCKIKSFKEIKNKTNKQQKKRQWAFVPLSGILRDHGFKSHPRRTVASPMS